MHPITVLSVIAVAVVFYKLLQFRSLQLDAREFFAQVRKELLNGRVREAAELCAERRGPAASVLQAGVLKIGAPRDEVVSAMDRPRCTSWRSSKTNSACSPRSRISRRS
jgi:biopolymer transport protein ExbB